MTDKPLVSHIFTADPSAHVFNGRLYIYPSHDIETDIEDNDNGDQYAMTDYHVLSMDSIGGEVTDHGVVLKMEDVPWVSKQMWAPDCAEKDGKYYLYFPARDHEDIFRIGVATASQPQGPFTPEPTPIPGSYSIDPAIFTDADGAAYLYFGGIWGGQLQCWSSGSFNASHYPLHGSKEPVSGPALLPRVAQLSSSMLTFSSPIQHLTILDPATSQPLPATDHARRFFEAPWVHRYNSTYYFSYSTGDTHFLCYATGKSPWGPFVYRGRILEPVQGWTTHHSIVEFGGRWWLFYHDASLSGGRNHLRCVKVREVVYDAEGAIGLV